METNLRFDYLTEENQLGSAFALMKELRPHLSDKAMFCAQMARQFQQRYQLLGARLGDDLVGLIGFRALENLLYGRFVYVDDLLVTTAQRRSGIGAQLLATVRRVAREKGCAHLVLDTGLHMPLAQRFYFREGLLAKGMHFVQALSGESLQHG